MASGAKRTGASAREAAAAAKKVAADELGSDVKRLRRQGGGLTNFVYTVEHPQDGGFVIRLGEGADKEEAFVKEAWAMGEAAKVGVPVAEVVAVGRAGRRFAYMVQRRVDGEDGTHHPDRNKVLTEMGRLTRTIHGIKTKGFGHTFDAKKGAFSGCRTWAEHCEKELKFEERLKVLHVNRMLSRPQGDRLDGILRDVAGWKVEPVLQHGDMRLKNVIVAGDPGKVAAVIDWELCASSVAPYWDLSLALHDLSIDAKHAFLDGYGCSETNIAEIADVLKAFNIINYAPFVAKAAKDGNEQRLERYRMRFSGALDLYSL